jgi:protein-S-isoprenylcysteine O-methyltransferase Ste14
VIDRAWLLTHLTLLRPAMLACCVAYWWLGCYWLKPRGRELPAAIMAAWVQFSLGLLLDAQVVRWGFWSYRPMPFTLGGVPLDVHLDWALLSGFLMVWLYSRLALHRRGALFALLYLGLWVLATSALDAIITGYLPFLTHHRSYWWLADILMLAGTLGVPLCVYHSILFPPEQRAWRVWGCRVRSALYLASLAYLFYGYLPAVVLSLTDGWNVRPLLPLTGWRGLAMAAALPVMLGAWATVAFTDTGLGTPLPLDPPIQLVTTGPYAFVRNPMQLAGLMLALILCLYHPTLYMLCYGIDMSLVSLVLFHLYESGELARRYGSDYTEYTQHVRNWLPRRRPYAARDLTPLQTVNIARQ